MAHFTPLSALSGGLLIGTAAIILLLFNGRIMGITGITRGVLQPRQGDLLWRVLFLASLIAAPLIYPDWTHDSIPVHITSSLPVLIVGGFLVGFGTCTANGCTSGHSVCGLGRFSMRSLIVTLTFLATAMLTVFVTHHLLGGRS